MRQLKITKSITNRESASLDKYLQEIGRKELITVDEEVELAQRIRQGDQAALDKLVSANLRFVVSVAKQYQNQGLSLPAWFQVYLLCCMVDSSIHPSGTCGTIPHRQAASQPGGLDQQDQ